MKQNKWCCNSAELVTELIIKQKFAKEFWQDKIYNILNLQSVKKDIQMLLFKTLTVDYLQISKADFYNKINMARNWKILYGVTIFETEYSLSNLFQITECAFAMTTENVTKVETDKKQ